MTTLSDFIADSRIYSIAGNIQEYRQAHKTENLKKLKNFENSDIPARHYDMTEMQLSYFFDRKYAVPGTILPTAGYVELDCPAYHSNRFATAWENLIRYHDILRTVFHEDGTQTVLETAEAVIREISSETAGLTEQQIATSRKELLAEPFRPEQPPQVNIHVLIDTNHSARIQLHFDAMILDGHSIALLLEELDAVYRGARTLPDAEPVRFSAYVSDLQARKKSDAYAQDAVYWQEERQKFPPALELPLLPYTGKVTPAQRSVTLTRSEWANLEQHAKQYGVTGFTVMLTIIGLALKRLTRERSFLICLPESVRPENGIFAETAGVFSNFLFFAFDGTSQPFSQKLRENQKQLLEKKRHSLYTGMENLRSMGQDDNSLGSGVVPVVVTSLLTEHQPLQTFRKVYAESHSSHIPLELVLDRIEDQIQLSVNYTLELFEPAVIAGLTERIENLAKALCAEHADWNAVWKAPILKSESEFLSDVNPAPVPFVYENTADLLRRSMQQYADRIALAEKQRCLTYSALQERVYAYCEAIRACHENPDKPVCILLKKSMEQIIAVVACVYAGVPYMPLEEDIPAERLKRCLANSHAGIVFCDLPVELPAGLHVIRPADLPQEANPCQPAQRQSDDCIAVIHTSGSTGTPKAVRIAHGALQNNLLYPVKKYHVTQEDAVIAVTNLAHDMSMFDLFGMLMTGGKIVIPTHEKRKDPLHWLELLRQEHVTIWNSVPALMEMFMLTVRQQNLKLDLPLRLFLHGGDYVHPEIPAFLYQTFPECQVVSVGGPTETTLWNISHEITQNDMTRKFIPYGKPMCNNNYYILDCDLEPVAVGATGYLYASGIGVSLGYLGDPERTAEKFVTDPHTGVRLYHTGDLGCYLPDGSIRFMGRDDAQIKINGKRIETEEIAIILQKCESVKACEVIGDIQKKKITAFYCAPEPIPREVFRDAVLRELPAYMMPSAWIHMKEKEFPLTPNGKIDRKRLLVMARAYQEQEQEQAQEKSQESRLSPEELQLKPLYDSFTGNSDYDPEDSFLIAGGNSLKAIQFTFALKQQYHTEIGLVEFFRNSSLRELATYLKAQQSRSESGSKIKSMKTEFMLPSQRHIPETEPFPLTELQQAYLVGRKSQMSLNIVTHGYVELSCENYDHEKFVRVAKKLIARHGVLRDVISYDGTQHISSELPEFTIPVVDLRERSERFRNRYLQYVRETMIRWKLDLEQIPLVRVHVNLLEHHRALLQIYFDTLIIDGSSYTMLSNELDALYSDENCELPEIGVTFRDYVMFKAYQKTTAEYETAKRYWQKRIETLPEAVTLPLQKNPDEIGLAHGIVKECKISMEAWRRIKSQAEQRGMTGFAVLFTIFLEVIARWNRKKRFLLSIPKGDRPPIHPDMNQMAGECATFLLFEVESRPEETLEQICQRNQQQIWEANEHSAFSGVEVLREVYKQKNAYGSALVPVVFSTLSDYQQTERRSLQTVYEETLTSQVWIDIDARILNHEMVMHWNVPDGLFHEAMLDDMTALEMDLMNRLADDETAWTRRLELPLPERDRKILTMAETDEMPLAPESMQRRIVESFRQNHDKILLVTGQKRMNYAQVATMISHKIKEMQTAGVRPGDRIAITLGKSAEQVICTLATVLLGAVYVPFEADVPVQRLQYCISNTECRFLFAEKDCYREIPGIMPLSPAIDTDPMTRDADLTYYDGSGDDLLTIIHTSGSTGRPKAVMVLQRGVRNCLDYTLQKFEIGSEDAVLALTNLAHDMSMFDLFGMLLAGGRIVMPAEKSCKDPAVWLQAIRQEHVTVWNSVPAMLQMLSQVMQQEHITTLPSVRRLFTGGDYLPVALMQTLYKALPGAMLVSVGGPTETTLWNIYHIITPEDFSGNKIPYGRPIANNRYTLRDENLRIVPAGVTGMMYCTGVGVTAGYCNDTKTTAEKYLFDEQGRRMYCTGDLGRYLPDGEIEFMGREDFQVKINGKRIELAEIEQAMEQVAGVTGAVVTVSPDQSQIWGYYLADADIPETALQSALRDILPVYMIPKFFTHLAQFPLSRTGKIDRKQLPAPEKRTEEIQAVLSPEAEKLLQIAGDVLGHQDLTLADNFFLAGGDSLLAIVFCKKLETAFQVNYSLTDIFEAPEFASILARLTQRDTRTTTVRQIRRQEQEHLPAGIEYIGNLSFAQEGIWTHEIFRDDNLFTLTGMCRITGALNLDVFRQAVQTAVRQYDVLRTYFDENEEFDPVLSVRREAEIPLQTEFVPEEQLAVALESLKSLHITLKDPQLAQFRLWDLGNAQYLFVMSIHHMICDQESFQLILRTIREQYFRILSGLTTGTDFCQETARYCDYATWERQNSLPADSVTFWQKQLAGISCTALPGAGMPDDQTAKGMTATVHLDADEISALLHFFEAHQVTRYIGFYTLFTQFLHQLTGERRIAVGSPVSVRHFVGMDDTPGLFVHETVFVSEQSEHPATAFAYNKRHIPETMTHSVLPFEKIAEHLRNSDKNRKRLPFHLHFNFIEEKSEKPENINSGNTLTFGALDYLKNQMQHNFGLYTEIREGAVLVQFTYKKQYLSQESAEQLAATFREYILRTIRSENQ